MTANIFVTFQTVDVPLDYTQNFSVKFTDNRLYLITYINLLMLFSEIIGTCENHVKHINTCVKSVKFMLLEQLVDTELNYSTSIILCHPGM